MTSMPNTPSRTTRRRVSLLTALLLAATLLTPATPALADFSGWDPPPDPEDDGGGGGRVTGTADVRCVQGDAWVASATGQHQIPGFEPERGNVWLLRPNNMCPDHTSNYKRRPGAPAGSVGGQVNLRQVGHGWEVWRFYGTPTQVLGYTVSFAGTPTWGSPAEVITVAPHPDDRQAVPAGTLPWRQHTYTTLGRDQITLFDGGAPSTNPPFRRELERCDNLVTRPDPVALALRSNPKDTRDRLFASYQTTVSGAGPTTAWRLGVTAINARNTGPIASPDAINPGYTLPCTSPFEYASYTPADGLSLAGAATGVCVMPLTRLQLQLSDGSWATLARYGHRYSTSYGRQNDYGLWRETVRAEVNSRPSSPYMLRVELAPRERHDVPAQPSTIRTSQPYLTGLNKAAAADIAADHANCRYGFPELEGLPEIGEGPGDRAPQLTMTLELPEVFQLGGALRSGQPVTVRHTPYTCEGGLPCPARTARQPVSGRNLPLTPDHLSHISYQLEVSANGLILCLGTNPAERCDWRMDGPNTRRGDSWQLTQPASEPRSPGATGTAASNWERVQQARLEFYSATNPGEQVRARITGVTARYATYRWERAQIGVTACWQRQNGAPRGTATGAIDNGPLPHRLNGQPGWTNVNYHTSTPGGSVQQWHEEPVYDYIWHGEPYIPADWAGGPRGQLWYGGWDSGTLVAGPSPFLETIFRGMETVWQWYPEWTCTEGVFDDWETSEQRDVPRGQIRVPLEESRPVIGTILR